jgi:predicted nucleic-acid-binding protein
MNAVDTNVLVRLFVEDDPQQHAAPRALIENEPIWIAKTVLLETDWVLRRFYGFEQNTVHRAFTRLLGLENVQTEDEMSVASALALMSHGLEFADALHLVSRPPGAAFVSFDRSLVRRAVRAGVTRISGVPPAQ